MERNVQKHEFLYLGTRTFPAQRLFRAAPRLGRTLALFALCLGLSRCRSRPGSRSRRSFQSRDHRVARGRRTTPIIVVVVVVVRNINIIAILIFAFEEDTVRQVIVVRGKAGLAAHSHALRWRRHPHVSREDERVPLLVGSTVVLHELDVIVEVEMELDLLDGEPANFDEAPDQLGREHAAVLDLVPHLPVGGDERGERVKELGGLARVGERLVGKVAHFDALFLESLYGLGFRFRFWFRF
ncbi:hypothetical protein BC827DRAFT_1200447 [Russula dissimulans]|nr:hypothetical protein BC827DRAFT_1200447 [Russula dissimulans]